MLRNWRDLHRHWEDWANMAIGLALALSPWFAQFADLQDATVSAVLAGLVLLIFAQLALARLEVWEEWVNLVLGLWLVAAPWVLGFGDRPEAAWTHIVLGALAAILAATELIEEFAGRSRHGSGRRA